SRRAVDEVAETAVADFPGGILDIIRGGTDTARGKRRIILERVGRLAYVPGKALDEVGARALLLARVVLQMVRRARRHLLGGISRLLEFVARDICRYA